MTAATATANQPTLKSYQLVAKLKQKIHRRRIRKAEAKLLKEVLDDATVDTNVDVPKTLKEALPDDMEIRASDNRAIVVTECTGKFNMIGCNQAWENLCGYAECEIIGKDSSVLQNPDTNHDGEWLDYSEESNFRMILYAVCIPRISLSSCS